MSATRTAQQEKTSSWTQSEEGGQESNRFRRASDGDRREETPFDRDVASRTTPKANPFAVCWEDYT